MSQKLSIWILQQTGNLPAKSKEATASRDPMAKSAPANKLTMMIQMPSAPNTMQRRQGIMEGDKARQKMPKDVVEKVQFEASSKQQQGIGPGTPQKHGAKSKQKCCLLLHWDSLKLEVKVLFYG